MSSTTPSQPDRAVLSLDPGILTGWAAWSQNGELVFWGNSDFDATLSLLRQWAGSVVVFEDYRLRYGRQPAADSHHVAAQIIGAVKYAYDEWYPQEVEVLTVEAMHLGLERPKNHKDGHYVDAVLHGAYWFRRVGIEPDISRLAAGSSA